MSETNFRVTCLFDNKIRHKELFDSAATAEYFAEWGHACMVGHTIEEVPSVRAVSGWHVGKNVPGYLPESDVTHLETWREALEALRDEIDRDADGLFEILTQEHLEEYDGAMAEIREILRGKNEEEGDGMYYHLPSSSSDRDLGISYWVEPCTEMECQREGEGE